MLRKNPFPISIQAKKRGHFVRMLNSSCKHGCAVIIRSILYEATTRLNAWLFLVGLTWDVCLLNIRQEENYKRMQPDFDALVAKAYRVTAKTLSTFQTFHSLLLGVWEELCERYKYNSIMYFREKLILNTAFSSR